MKTIILEHKKTRKMNKDENTFFDFFFFDYFALQFRSSPLASTASTPTDQSADCDNSLKNKTCVKCRSVMKQHKHMLFLPSVILLHRFLLVGTSLAFTEYPPHGLMKQAA